MRGGAAARRPLVLDGARGPVAEEEGEQVDFRFAANYSVMNHLIVAK